MTSPSASDRLGIRLDSCGDGKEMVTEVGPVGRAVGAVAVGCTILEIIGKPATSVKNDLAAGRILPRSSVTLKLLRLGETEPVTIVLPALDDVASESGTPATEAASGVDVDVPLSPDQPPTAGTFAELVAESMGTDPPHISTEPAPEIGAPSLADKANAGDQAEEPQPKSEPCRPVSSLKEWLRWHDTERGGVSYSAVPPDYDPFEKLSATGAP
jgi:hypothetical protein